MTLDQYSICPCGSGKKVKFCKCAEHLSEMAKIDRMVDGDQSVAALDKINQLLKTFPNEAWLYAYKCEIQLKLRELEGLEETSATSQAFPFHGGVASRQHRGIGDPSGPVDR
jgi:hypothetical protein